MIRSFIAPAILGILENDEEKSWAFFLSETLFVFMDESQIFMERALYLCKDISTPWIYGPKWLDSLYIWYMIFDD